MCLYPSTIKGVDAFGVQVVMSVPCGKCIECLKDRQNSWKIRLVEESREHLYTYFFTLTYNEDSVPFTYLEDGTKLLHVNKVDIQLWIKRNRMRFERLFNRKVDFKYFICSEYGPNTGRPHYHGILFTEISKTFITSMFNDWNSEYGFTNFSLVGSDGKKKLPEVPSVQSAIMLLSTALSRSLSERRPNETLTNIAKLVEYHFHFIS